MLKGLYGYWVLVSLKIDYNTNKIRVHESMIEIVKIKCKIDFAHHLLI